MGQLENTKWHVCLPFISIGQSWRIHWFLMWISLFQPQPVTYMHHKLSTPFANLMRKDKIVYLPFPYAFLSPTGHSIMGATSNIIGGSLVPGLNVDAAIYLIVVWPGIGPISECLSSLLSTQMYLHARLLGGLNVITKSPPWPCAQRTILPLCLIFCQTQQLLFFKLPPNSRYSSFLCFPDYGNSLTSGFLPELLQAKGLLTCTSGPLSKCPHRSQHCRAFPDHLYH